MFEDLDIPQNFREELLPLLESLMQLQEEIVAIASKFNPQSYYFIATLLTLPSRHYTGLALHSFANSGVSRFIELVEAAGRGEHHSNDMNRTIIDQLRFVIDYDYATVCENLEEIRDAVEVGSEGALKERQEQYRANKMKQFPALAQARRSRMH